MIWPSLGSRKHEGHFKVKCQICIIGLSLIAQMWGYYMLAVYPPAVV